MCHLLFLCTSSVLSPHLDPWERQQFSKICRGPSCKILLERPVIIYVMHLSLPSPTLCPIGDTYKFRCDPSCNIVGMVCDYLCVMYILLSSFTLCHHFLKFYQCPSWYIVWNPCANSFIYYAAPISPLPKVSSQRFIQFKIFFILFIRFCSVCTPHLLYDATCNADPVRDFILQDSIN